MSAFIDTNVFVAYFNKRDFHHDRAFRLMQKLGGGEYGEIYISDYIFSETVTVIALRTNLENAIDVGNLLLETDITMLRVDDEVFDEAWKIFQTAEMSFTDCTIASVVKLLGIEKLATFDEGFKKFDWLEIID
jgi:predicted nucleic acid-binding protein